jgi:hypothetical protein
MNHPGKNLGIRIFECGHIQPRLSHVFFVERHEKKCADCMILNAKSWYFLIQ